MMAYVGTIAGLLITVIGAYMFFTKGKEERKYLQLFGFVSFLGSFIFLLAFCSLLMVKLSDVDSIYFTGLLFFGLFVSSYVFLKPGFKTIR